MRRRDARILLVETDISSRAALQHALRRLGCLLIEEAPTAPEAMELLGEQHYDLVFCSHELPPVCGLELIRWIRQSPHLHGLPVVVAAPVTTQLVLDAAEAGVSAFLPHPFGLPNLEELLRVFIGRPTLASPEAASFMS